MMSQTHSGWSNREVSTLRQYRSKLFETQQQELLEKILMKEDNCMSFYQITPKDELPKNLQKMSFQTLNTKENIIDSVVKVHKKESLSKKQFNIRKMLRDNGEIMLLSEIYNYLDDPLESQKVKEKKLKNEVTPLPVIISQLDEWEKNTSKKGTLEARFSKIRQPNSSTDERRNSTHKKQFIAKKFKIGSDYKAEVLKSLQVIFCSHKNEPNLMSRYALIENSSKMLKKQLEEMKEIVQKEIEEKMKKLAESRKEHHRLYEEKLRLQIEGQELDEEMAKEEGNNMHNNNGYGFHGLNQTNIKIVFEDKKNEIEKNQVKINKIKKNIEFLEEETLKNEEQLKNIIVAETVYYKVSLKNGVDCRDSGLVWVIKRLGLQQSDIPNIEFPQYLDKKSKVYLINKAKSEEVLQGMLREKRLFIREIGKECESTEKRTSFRSASKKSSIKLEKPIKCQQADEIKECIGNQCDTDIPKRYSRSVKKITALREQYLKNQNLFKLTQNRGGLKLGYNLNGLTGKQIYNVIGQKIKQVDFTKLKKEKGQDKNDKIFEYQAILRRIEDLHMEIEEQDIQHEGHLLSQYKDQKQLFFTLAAACFGIKRAYTLIIKNFSWKNTS